MVTSSRGSCRGLELYVVYSEAAKVVMVVGEEVCEVVVDETKESAQM